MTEMKTKQFKSKMLNLLFKEVLENLNSIDKSNSNKKYSDFDTKEYFILLDSENMELI